MKRKGVEHFFSFRIYFQLTFGTKYEAIYLFMKQSSTKSKIWDKLFKNEPRKICVRQPLKNLKGYGLLRH